MNKITILGSTGNIGTQALTVIRNHKDLFKIEGLSCNKDIETLRKQIEEFKPSIVAVFDENKAKQLRKQINIEVLSGLPGLIELAKYDSSNLVLISLVGSIGIQPTVEAIKAKKTIALANKETLVSAGEIVMKLVKENKVELRPVDSEHSAIFQCMVGRELCDIKKIILTCSGGAFRNNTKEELLEVTVSDALCHPSWNMGRKITIDSATLMNKGFEVIEAKMLFGVDYDDIEVIVHPSSIVHSLVELKNNSVLAQLSVPDMNLPIEYALSYPKVLSNNLKNLNLSEIGQLHFFKPDVDKFPCLKYAYEAGRLGGIMPCILNAVNEVAVQAFLDEKIKFMDIPQIIRKEIDRYIHLNKTYPDLDEIVFWDYKVKQDLKREMNYG